jgi:hypothetical protein
MSLMFDFLFTAFGVWAGVMMAVAPDVILPDPIVLRSR